MGLGEVVDIVVYGGGWICLEDVPKSKSVLSWVNWSVENGGEEKRMLISQNLCRTRCSCSCLEGAVPRAKKQLCALD